MKEDQKNFLLFAVLAGLILFGSNYITSWFFPQNPPSAKVEKGQLKPVPNAANDPTADSPKATRDRALVLTETPRVRIETPTLRGSINLKGAQIDDLELTRYNETIAPNSAKIRLLSPDGAQGAYFAEFGWRGAGVKTPSPDTVWQASGTRLAPGSPVTLTASNASGQRFRIELSVDDTYMFSIRQVVENRGAAAAVVTPYALVKRAEKSKDYDQFGAHVGPIAVENGSARYIDYGSVASDKCDATQFGDVPGYCYRSNSGWLGFTDHYWLTALVPHQGAGVTFLHRPTPNGGFQADYSLTAPLTIAPGREVSYSSRFFAGAKEVAALDAYQAQGVPLFGLAIEWGWFEIVEKPIFHYLHWLYQMIGNFGVAIILLTCTIRLLLFPIAQRQFASMAQMRAVQPKMKALQERYKDDKPKLQTEMMKLYKDEKVNPVAGCLPLLLQIPIMFALYKVLLLTIEMRHEPFALWIKDLSVSDPALLLTGFGLWPWHVPSFLAIGVFPILLGASMYVQIKLNPAPMDEMQKQVFAIMPWMLMFLMAPFAVGLQLYWITSNVLTVAQQWFLYRKHPALKEPLPKKEAAAK